MINLTDGAPDRVEIVSWMLFPGDAALRSTYRARVKIADLLAATRSTDFVSINATDLAAVMDGPSHREMVALAAESTKDGHIAGLVLWHIYKQSVDRAEEPSLNKALKFYKSEALHGRFKDGSPWSRSETSLRKSWAEFESVAHLWAALESTKPGAPNPDGVAYQSCFSDQQSMIEFLGRAAGIGEFAATFIPKRTKPAKSVIARERLVPISPEIPIIRLVRRPLQDGMETLS